jgi:hypothetical protein
MPTQGSANPALTIMALRRDWASGWRPSGWKPLWLSG